MSEHPEGRGSCLCGAVSVHVTPMQATFGACHCSMCRKWGGGPFLSVQCGTGATFTGEEDITVADTSAWAERGFCRKCGTHLFYRVKSNGHVYVPVGVLDEGAPSKLAVQVFIDEKPESYTFAEETKELTGAEIFAMFAPKDGQ